MACEPFYSKPSYRILATCAFYFPTTMVLMYCYGSSFHASRFRLFVPATSMVTGTTTVAASSINGNQSNGSTGVNNGHHSGKSNNQDSATQNNNLKVIHPTKLATNLHIYCPVATSSWSVSVAGVLLK